MSKKNKFENALEEMTVVEATPLEDVPEVPQITEEQQREVQDYIGRNPVVRAHLKTIEDYCVAMKPGKAMDLKMVLLGLNVFMLHSWLSFRWKTSVIW